MNVQKIFTKLLFLLLIIGLSNCSPTSQNQPIPEPTFRTFVTKIQSHQQSRNALTIEPLSGQSPLQVELRINGDTYKDTVLVAKSIVEFQSPVVSTICTIIGTTSDGKKFTKEIPIEIISKTTPEMVLIGDTLWVATSEVTQTMWEAVMDTNESTVVGENYPIEKVSWYEAIEYCNRLSLSKGFTPYYIYEADTIRYDKNSKGYRLPFEYEWIFATFNSAKTALFNGDLSYEGCFPLDTLLNEIGWYCANTQFPRPVKLKKANDFGLFDVHGNVWEWCNDWVQPFGDTKLLKGGSWYNDAHFSLRTHFYNLHPADKFRIYSFRVFRSN